MVIGVYFDQCTDKAKNVRPFNVFEICDENLSQIEKLYLRLTRKCSKINEIR